MKTVKHTLSFYATVSIAALVLYILDSTGIMTLKIGTAHPLLLLPLLVSVAMAAREWAALVFGIYFGVLLDITAAGSYFFNLVVLAVIGCVCGLLCSYRVNDNIYSALALSLFSSAAYFISKWFVFCLFAGHGDAWQYLLRYSIPSILYTTIFVIPFYYLVKFVSKRTNYIV